MKITKKCGLPLLIAALALSLLSLHQAPAMAITMDEAVTEDISDKESQKKEKEKKKKEKEDEEEHHNAGRHDDPHRKNSPVFFFFDSPVGVRFGAGYSGFTSSVLGLNTLSGPSLYYESLLVDEGFDLAYFADGKFLSGTNSVGTPVSMNPVSVGIKLSFPLSPEIKFMGGLGYGVTNGLVGATQTYDEGTAFQLGLLYQLGGPFSLRAEYDYQGLTTGYLSGVSGSANLTLHW